MASSNCGGLHHYFVADVIAVPSTGKVHLLYLCTDCGDSHCQEFAVASPNADIRLLKEEKGK